ncbi:MAG: alpha/beta hydrolase family protein [Myxococcota bacterium]
MLSRLRLLALVLSGLLAFAGCADDSNNANNQANNGADTGADAGTDADETDGGDAGGDTDAGTSDPLFDPGPYKVGYKEVEIAYTAPGAEEDRVLPMKVWYPAVDDTQAEPVTYQVAGVVQIETDGALDAPEASADGPFPLTVYSHGSGGEGLLAYPYAESFASHGWIVAAPNHVGNTALDGLQQTSAPFAEIMLYRVLDITAVLDALENGFGDEDVDGLSDMDHVFLFGHSFGAYTTLAAGGADVDFDALNDNCSSFGQESCDFLAEPTVEAAFRDGFGDERIDAIAPQAPALVQSFGVGELAGITLPTMLQSGNRDQTTTREGQALPAWEALDDPEDVWVEVLDGGHLSFISICRDLSDSLINQFQPNADEDGCGESFIDIDVALTNLNAYLLAYARLHVLGQADYQEVIVGEPLHEGFVITVDADAN